MTDANESLGVPEAATKLNCCPATVRARIKSGELPAFKLGTGPRAQYRIRRSDLEAFRKSQAVEPELESAALGSEIAELEARAEKMRTALPGLRAAAVEYAKHTTLIARITQQNADSEARASVTGEDFEPTALPLMLPKPPSAEAIERELTALLGPFREAAFIGIERNDGTSPRSTAPTTREHTKGKIFELQQARIVALRKEDVNEADKLLPEIETAVAEIRAQVAPLIARWNALCRQAQPDLTHYEPGRKVAITPPRMPAGFSAVSYVQIEPERSVHDQHFGITWKI